MKKAISVISIILGAVLLVLAAFGIYVLLEATNYFKAKPTDFWLTVDGQRYYADSTVAFVDNTVTLNYLVGWLSKKQGYTYELVPDGYNFTFDVDGFTQNWLEQDLTQAFEITETDSGITVSGNTVLRHLLQELYPEQKVTVTTKDYAFKLAVTSINGKTITLTFFGGNAPDSIEITPPSIVF